MATAGSETSPYSVSYPLFSTSSETSSFPASTLPPPLWDVFISFRGEDTRYNFTSHLYASLTSNGIQTYMDTPELRTGEVISDALIEAIQTSKIYVVVFSENYASSPWCLDELVEISKCSQLTKRLVVGVYYKIQPTAVRHQTGSFGQAFQKHEDRLAGRDKGVEMVTVEREKVAEEWEKLNRWRSTLRNVAGFSGITISETRSEADAITEIVDVILLEINPKSLYVTEHPVGLDARVNDITKLLSSGTEGVIKIGLYGMGGVGKSTLAKAVYNQLLPERTFKGSSFLAEVREASQRANGIVSLQQQLLDDVLKSKKKVKVRDADKGTMLIKERLCLAKVLVVIDDIDDHKQYKSLVGPFASGSVVIVTTRNEEILEKIGVESKYRCKVKELDKAESLVLFTHHAFGNAKPENTLAVLFEEILSLAGGLPIALEVFGSYLSTRTEVGWKSYIEKLKRNPDSSIQEKLVISLNAIKSDDPMLEKIFLDIACFFIGRQKQEVVDIMETYYSFVEHNIDILKKRCLLKIDEGDNLGMHELLRDMGMEVAKNKSPDEPGKHSRLWELKDIWDVLKKHKGTEAIEGIIPSNFHYQNIFEGVSFETETFKSMSILRFLYIENVDLSGSFEQTFENLRWLRWDSCPLECLPSDFCPEKLVILALRSSKLRTMWKLNMDSQVFENLKTLDMSYSLDLTVTPDFTKLPRLETLNLKGCRSLKEVHVSIGCLVNLAYLNWRGSVKLRSLPDSICDLRALKRLNMEDCSSLEALPIKLGNIESLTELNACGLTTVSKIPDSIIHLSNLHEMNLGDYEYGTPSPNRWDVFLSFYGMDSINMLAKSLFNALQRNGVKTFRDDPQLRRGEAMSKALIRARALRESQTYIVVFSKYYIYSRHCLDELVEILKSHKKTKRLIIGVYNKIEPSVVQHQTECLEAAFRKYETRYKGKMEKVDEWRRTLREVAGFPGPHISNRDADESIIVETVCNAVLPILNFRRNFNVAGYSVGLDCRVEHITRLLSSDMKGVIKIGLYGFPGVGKTTLANALYNKLLLRSFKGRCFLANVREVSRTTKGLVSLQRKLIHDVLRTMKVDVHNVDQGRRIIQSIICLTKILVVIDDLDDHKQFESLVGPFASGSVVIVTTRYEEILDKIEVEPKYRYRVNVLNDAESLELFTRHAFRNAIPDNTLLELSKDIVQRAGGLPSALVASGSHLYNQPEVAWKDYIEKHISKDSMECDDQKDSIGSESESESELDEDENLGRSKRQGYNRMMKRNFLESACSFL